MFSRNYLGVHTPQDVICGFALTVLMLVLLSRLLRWADVAANRDGIVVIVSLILSVIAMRQEIKLAGSGGQGIILASVILAEAAVLSGKEAAQSQSYGPEARGGSCKAEVIVSDRPIGFTKVRKPTFLMALTQDAFDKYYPGVTPECVVLADADMDGHLFVELLQVSYIVDALLEFSGETRSDGGEFDATA